MTRKMIPINEEYHNKLNLLAAFHHRSMTAEVAYMVEEAWNEYMKRHGQITVSTEELANIDAE